MPPAEAGFEQALLYAATLRIALNSDQVRLSDTEQKVSWITAASSAAFLFVIAWKPAAGGYFGALKLLLYDLHELETVNRILSFIVLGLILVGVSRMDTRFRLLHPALSLTLMSHRVNQIIDPVAVRQRGHRLRINR